MSTLENILFEGYTAKELLALPQSDFDEYVFCDDALIIEIGSSKILGKFSVYDNRLVLELAQIDGGGEGVLTAISVLAQKVAVVRGFSEIEWQVHAVHCAQPNLKLRRVLLRRGFDVKDINGVGEIYHKVFSVEY